MKLSESVVPISYAKAHASELLENIARDRNPVIITQNGKAQAILLDLESYEELQESLGLLKILAQGQEDVRNKRYRPFRKAFAQIRKEAHSK